MHAGDLGGGLPAPSEDERAPRAISEANAWIITDLLRDVIRRGTGQRARALGRNDIAGKTGTTNDGRDAWFSGFNTGLVATAWVGFDEERPLGADEEGARTALPMWIYFMREALAGTPEYRLPMPYGVVTARVAVDTGEFAEGGVPASDFEYFLADHLQPGVEGASPFVYYAMALAPYGHRSVDGSDVKLASVLVKGIEPNTAEVIIEAARDFHPLNLWWLDLARQYTFLGPVVVGCRFEHANLVPWLDAYSQYKQFAGIRTMPPGPPSDWNENTIGANGLRELAQRKPENLFQKLGEVNQAKKLVRRLPTLSQVGNWVDQAKQLPGIITY